MASPCDEFIKNPNKDPISQRFIPKTSPVYLNWLTRCRDHIDALPEELKRKIVVNFRGSQPSRRVNVGPSKSSVRGSRIRASRINVEPSMINVPRINVSPRRSINESLTRTVIPLDEEEVVEREEVVFEVPRREIELSQEVHDFLFDLIRNALIARDGDEAVTADEVENALQNVLHLTDIDLLKYVDLRILNNYINKRLPHLKEEVLRELVSTSSRRRRIPDHKEIINVSKAIVNKDERYIYLIATMAAIVQDYKLKYNYLLHFFEAFSEDEMYKIFDLTRDPKLLSFLTNYIYEDRLLGERVVRRAFEKMIDDNNIEAIGKSSISLENYPELGEELKQRMEREKRQDVLEVLLTYEDLPSSEDYFVKEEEEEEYGSDYNIGYKRKSSPKTKYGSYKQTSPRLGAYGSFGSTYHHNSPYKYSSTHKLNSPRKYGSTYHHNSPYNYGTNYKKRY
jgi:hypothetical protein